MTPPEYSPIEVADPASSSHDDANQTSEDLNGNSRLYAKPIVDQFADIGSICAVLRPNVEEDFIDRIVSASRASDILVLDWRIGDSVGSKTLEVVHQVLDGDEPIGRLRLIAIYTVDPDLEGIAARINQTVDGEITADNVLVIKKESARIIVLGKNGPATNTRPEFDDHIVAETDLAARLVREFSLMTTGLLRNVALAGITAIREHAHNVLAKFEPSLDPAYLGHRLLQPD